VATTSTRLMTFEEFEKLPDHPHGHRCELRHGEPVFVPRPKHGHNSTQLRLLDLLGRAAGDAGKISMEMGFRPLPEHEYRIADVAFVAKVRWDGIPWDGNLSGSPELVIEVLSPSNTARGMRDKRKLCLETGSREFWVVDLDLREVEVSTAGGPSVIYACGQEIPLFFAEKTGGCRLAVDAIFS
jgi:Uma2 family endonuclease